MKREKQLVIVKPQVNINCKKCPCVLFVEMPIVVTRTISPFLPEGSFEWVDGSPLDYTNWLGVNPGNGGPTGNEDHVVLTPSGHAANPYMWNDVSGNLERTFICHIRRNLSGTCTCIPVLM